MVTFQCQLDSSMIANSAEPMTSCPLFQTWLNEPELDNQIHCQRFVSDKCTLLSKLSTNYMTMPLIVQLQERNFVSEHHSPIIHRTLTEHSPSITQTKSTTFPVSDSPFGNHTVDKLFRENKMKTALELWSKYSALRSNNDKNNLKFWNFLFLFED